MHEACVNKVLRCRIRDAYANAVEELKAVYMSDFPGSWLIVIESLVNKEIIIPIKGIERKVQIHTWNAMQAYNIIMLIDYMFKVTTPEEPRSFETLGSQFSVLGDVPNLDSGQTQSTSSIRLLSDPKSEFSGTKSLDPDSQESQICLLGQFSHLN